MNLERAKQIKGYMTDAELEWLAAQASTHKLIVEVGSLFGRSTVAMAENTKGKVVAVDKFWDLMVDYKEENQPEAFKIFMNNIRGLDNIEVIVTDHAYLEPIKDADMVFIDGTHDYNSVKRDISKWMDNRNILLSGHDYGDPVHVDVKRAVDELLPFAKRVEGTSIWYFQA